MANRAFVCFILAVYAANLQYSDGKIFLPSAAILDKRLKNGILLNDGGTNPTHAIFFLKTTKQ